MTNLVKICKNEIVSISIVVFLVRCARCAPSSASPGYTHDSNVGLKTKRSADFIDILSNLLLGHSDGEDSVWPSYGNNFNDNDYPMKDWMTYENEIPQGDYDNHFADYLYSGRNKHYNTVDLSSLDGLDYSCSEEESNDVVPFVEPEYKYDSNPRNSYWDDSNDGDFVVIKPEENNVYRYNIENEFRYGTRGGSVANNWNTKPPRDKTEIEEILWKQFATQRDKKPHLTKTTQPKFDIITCLSEPPKQELDTKSIQDDYLILLVKKDQLLGGSKNEETPRTSTILMPETDDDCNTSTTESSSSIYTTTASTNPSNTTSSGFNTSIAAITQPTSTLFIEIDKSTTENPVSSTSTSTVTIISGLPTTDNSKNTIVAITERPFTPNLPTIPIVEATSEMPFPATSTEVPYSTMVVSAITVPIIAGTLTEIPLTTSSTITSSVDSITSERTPMVDDIKVNNEETTTTITLAVETTINPTISGDNKNETIPTIVYVVDAETTSTYDETTASAFETTTAIDTTLVALESITSAYENSNIMPPINTTVDFTYPDSSMQLDSTAANDLQNIDDVTSITNAADG